MYKWVIRIRKWLRYIYEFLFVTLVVDFFLCASDKDLLDSKTLLLLAGILVVSYIFRDIMAYAISLLIIHGLMAVGSYFLLGQNYLGIVMILTVIGIFIDAVAYMKRGYYLKRAFEAPWDIFFLGVAISLLAAYKHDNTLQSIGYVSVIIMLSINLFSIYLEGLEDYISLNRRVKGVPIGRMVSVNTFIVTTVLCIIITTIILADVLGLPKVVAGFCMAMIGLLRVLIILIGIFLSFISGLFGTTFVSPQRGFQEIEKIVIGESIFGKIIYFVLSVLFIACTAYVLIRLCRFVIRWLLARQDRRYDTTEDLDTKTKKRVERTRVEKIDEGGYLSPEQRARRIYKKRVLSYKKYFKPGANISLQ